MARCHTTGPALPLLPLAVSALLLLLMGMATAQDSGPSVASCSVSIKSSAIADSYTSLINCTGSSPITIRAHASPAVNHSITYIFNGEALESGEFLEYSSVFDALLTLEPSGTSAVNSSLQLQAYAQRVVLPSEPDADGSRAYSALLVQDFASLAVHDTNMLVHKNVNDMLDPSYFDRDYSAPPAPPLDPANRLFLFEETYIRELTAATIMYRISQASSFSLRDSVFAFSGDSLSDSDYFTYYGGYRSFPDVQLSAVLLLRLGDSSRFNSVDVFNSTFTGHTASNGGALSIPEPVPMPSALSNERPVQSYMPVPVSIVECLFDSNAAYFKGGAIFLGYNTNLTMQDVMFVNNSIVDNDKYYHRVRETFGYRGGAVYLFEPSAVSISNTIFDGNRALNSWEGGMSGALHIALRKNVFGNNEVTIGPYVVFQGNSANVAGAMAVEDTTLMGWEGDVSIDIYDSLFSSNSAEVSAGALYLLGPTEVASFVGYSFDLNVSSTAFVDNVAKAGEGGAILAHRLQLLTVGTSRFMRNQADTGGAVALTYCPETFVDASEFVGNSARDAGAISLHLAGMAINASSFRNNMATGGSGGAVKANPPSIVVTLSSFINNTAGDSAGAISVQQDLAAGKNSSEGYLTEKNLAWVEASSRGLDGSSYNSILLTGYEVYKPITEPIAAYIMTSEFIDNKAGRGGAVTVQGSTVFLSRVNLTRNSAGTGGAVFGSGCADSIIIRNSLLTNNTAQGVGGAVASGSCILAFDSVLLQGNEAMAGAGVYAGLNIADSHLGSLFSASLLNCSVAGNMVQAGSGSGLCVAGVTYDIQGGSWAPSNAAATAKEGCSTLLQ